MEIFTKTTLVSMAMLCISIITNGQDTWTQKANFAGDNRAYAIGFSIGNRGYIGGGISYSSNATYFYYDCWEYNPDSDAWHKNAYIGQGPVAGSAGFSIGSKGYIVGGAFSPYSWQYDTATNEWTHLSDFPGMIREYPVAFTIGSKAYFGLGSNTSVAGGCLNDFWEYNPANDGWTRIADFPGLPRSSASAFSIGNKGYVGTGYDSLQNEDNDFYEYDPSTNKWTKKANIGTFGRDGGIGFSLNGYGYMGLGEAKGQPHVSDTWQYDTAADKWTQVTGCDTSFTSVGCVAFTIGNKAYIGTGSSDGNLVATYGNGFWEFSDHTSGIEETKKWSGISIYPNPSTGKFNINSSVAIQGYEVTDINGRIVSKDTEPYSANVEINLSLANGIYFIKVMSKQGIMVRKLLVCGN